MTVREKCEIPFDEPWNRTDANIVSLQLCIYGFIMNDNDVTNCRHFVNDTTNCRHFDNDTTNCRQVDNDVTENRHFVCEQVFRHTHSFLFKDFVELSIFIASTNSFFNPLIYLRCSTEFRTIVKKFWKNLKLKYWAN
jgi:hypothetical protein